MACNLELFTANENRSLTRSLSSPGFRELEQFKNCSSRFLFALRRAAMFAGILAAKNGRRVEQF